MTIISGSHHRDYCDHPRKDLDRYRTTGTGCRADWLEALASGAEDHSRDEGSWRGSSGAILHDSSEGRSDLQYEPEKEDPPSERFTEGTLLTAMADAGEPDERELSER